jgi:hypothetical protein
MKISFRIEAEQEIFKIPLSDNSRCKNVTSEGIEKQVLKKFHGSLMLALQVDESYYTYIDKWKNFWFWYAW